MKAKLLGFAFRSNKQQKQKHMGYFNNEVQDNFKADFGFSAPHRTKKPCSNPVFADKTLHRLAIMKDFHLGHKGDVEENGLPGWVAKFVCTGCGKEYKNKVFFRDKQSNNENKSA